MWRRHQLVKPRQRRRSTIINKRNDILYLSVDHHLWNAIMFTNMQTVLGPRRNQSGRGSTRSCFFCDVSGMSCALCMETLGAALVGYSFASDPASEGRSFAGFRSICFRSKRSRTWYWLRPSLQLSLFHRLLWPLLCEQWNLVMQVSLRLPRRPIPRRNLPVSFDQRPHILGRQK